MNHSDYLLTMNKFDQLMETLPELHTLGIFQAWLNELSVD